MGINCLSKDVAPPRGNSMPLQTPDMGGTHRKAGEELREQGFQGPPELLPEVTSVPAGPGGVLSLCVGDLQGRNHPLPLGILCGQEVLLESGQKT